MIDALKDITYRWTWIAATKRAFSMRAAIRTLFLARSAHYRAFVWTRMAAY